jgi:hypothetical protein
MDLPAITHTMTSVGGVLRDNGCLQSGNQFIRGDKKKQALGTQTDVAHQEEAVDGDSQGMR